MSAMRYITNREPSRAVCKLPHWFDARSNGE